MPTGQRNLMENYRPPPWPEDFGRRLEGLKRLTGLSWQGFAGRLGVTDRGVLQWRRGKRRPSRENFQAIMALAQDLPGGFDLMNGGDAAAGDCAGGREEDGDTDAGKE